MPWRRFAIRHQGSLRTYPHASMFFHACRWPAISIHGQELRDVVEADLKVCGTQTDRQIPRTESLFLAVALPRLESLPASGAGVSANDFFQSFKLACEAAGGMLNSMYICFPQLSSVNGTRPAKADSHRSGGPRGYNLMIV